MKHEKSQMSEETCMHLFEKGILAMEQLVVEPRELHGSKGSSVGKSLLR